MNRRTRALVLTALAAVIVAALAGSLASGSAPEGKEPATGGEDPRPPKADRDRDKLSEDLEARLGRLQTDDRLSVIVSLRGEPTPRRIRAVQEKVGRFRVTHRLSLIDAFAARVTKRQALAFSRLSDVRQVEEDSRVHALNDSAQASFGVTKARTDQPGLDGNADDKNTYSKDDLVAAVIDSGIDAAHQDLDDGKVLGFASCLASTATGCVETPPIDDGGHGTHVAATIAGEGEADPRYKGVAPGAALVGVQVLTAAGGSESDAVAGIQWVLNNRTRFGIEAINLSLGTKGYCGDGTEASSRAVDAAHDAARRRGRRGQRGSGHVYRRVTRRGDQGAHRRRDGGPRPERLLPGRLLKPRPHQRRPRQARRLRAGGRHHLGRSGNHDRLRDRERH